MNFLRVFVNLFQFNRTNWKAVVLCFVTATIFWFFSALNKNHTTNIRFPLRFEYDQDKYTPAEELPRQVTLNISGNGWDLFRKYFGLRLPTLIVPLDKTEPKQISGYSLLSVFASQLSNLKINFVVTDSLRVHLDEIKSRKVKLTSDLSGITYKGGFGRVSRVVILPDSAQLTGPKSIINKLPDSIVIRLQEKKLNENFRQEVEIALSSSEFINRNPPIAEVMFEVAEMRQIDKWVKVRVNKLPWGIELVRDSVQATIQVSQQSADDVIASSLWASLDLSELQKGEIRLFAPHVEGLPLWASVIRIDSVSARRY